MTAANEQLCDTAGTAQNKVVIVDAVDFQPAHSRIDSRKIDASKLRESPTTPGDLATLNIEKTHSQRLSHSCASIDRAGFTAHHQNLLSALLNRSSDQFPNAIACSFT
jgi:hypothetical protein